VQVLTVKAAAELLEVDPKTVYRLVERGQLPAFKVGKQWRMRLSDLEAWIEGQVRARETTGTYRARQAPLFGGGAGQADGGNALKAGFSDSAFSENSHLPIHRWVPWIAGFSAQFVGEALDRCLPEGVVAEQRVLDPFAGVGTTLVAALLRGHPVYGFEINPYAARVCDLKLKIPSIPVEALARSLDDFAATVDKWVASGREPNSSAPPGFATRNRFLSPAVERKVLLLQDFIADIEDGLVRACFEVALASELVGFSNYSYEPSLGTRAAAGKPDIEDAPVVRKLVRKLGQMLEDVKAAQAAFAEAGGCPAAEFYAGDFFEHERVLPDASIDLVVTSPPYLNNYHYVRNSRPQVYWLGLVSSPADLKQIEETSFGKFWQTVRAEAEIPLAFPMPELEDSLGLLRARNADKGIYGGSGWANYATTYFNDCMRFARILRRVLKPGGRAAVVLGNSILQGVEFKTDQLFGRICEACGLDVKDIHLLRKKRTGASIIQSSVRANAAEEKTTLYESAVIVANNLGT
jgi:excisionase family DNA binding protein